MGTPVSIALDLTGGPTTHIVYVPNDNWDNYAPMNWLPGKLANKHSISTDVFHKGLGIVLDGHDQGPLLLHAPFSNPVHMFKSSRKTIYAASKILINGKASALTDAGKKPMMNCGDPFNLPNGTNIINAGHSVFLGATALDVFKGKVAIVVSLLTDFMTMPEEITPEGIVADLFGIDPMKVFWSSYFNLAGSVLVSAESGWEEPIVLKEEMGSSYASRSKELAYDPKSKAWSYKETESFLGYKEETTRTSDGQTKTEKQLFGEPYKDPFDGVVLS